MEIDRKKPIGVFDSGIGGLSVLRQLVRFLPYERYIYLGDTARVPYGNKSEAIVKQYAEECTQFLVDKGVKMIVVACNTVSSVAMDSVYKIAGKLPVIDMIKPATAAALRATMINKIGVIGTRATIGSDAYSIEIKKLSDERNVNVLSQACPMFVPIVEEGMVRHEAAKLIALEYLSHLKREGIDTLVLGCTHYPLLMPLLTELLPGVNMIDSGEHAAVTALRSLANNNTLDDERNEFVEKPDIKFYVTDLPTMFYDLAREFLGFSVDTPEVVSPGEGNE